MISSPAIYAKPAGYLRASSPIIAPTRLRHGAERLFGREDDLKRIDAAWDDLQTHVLTIVAWGGVGKTSLVVEWMARRARDGWLGFERVFDWSFYSQGTCDRGATSADQFVDAALRFFDDPAPAQGSPWDKGARLARLVAQHRTLLVLDGIEPLQHPPGPLEGELKDPAIEALLKGLAQCNIGLCLVTSRQRMRDLAPFGDIIAPQWRLACLSRPAGTALLRDLGVKGSKRECERLVKDVEGHALTLSLLGRYLALAHGGDIHKRDLVRFEDANETEGGHAFRVMAAYEQWLQENDDTGMRARAVLRLLGLFNRPADAACLFALRAPRAIAGLTEPLVGLSEARWNTILKRLEECGLLSLKEEQATSQDQRYAIDAHPLIRAYFASQLREFSPVAWRAGHQRLFLHLRTHSERRPKQLPEMMGSLHAVMHGCYAGQYERALALFRQRVRQGQSNVSVWKLGAFTADLDSLRCFLAERDRPSNHLCASARAYVCNEIGADLRALGRFQEARGMIDTAVAIQEGLSRDKAGARYQRRAYARLANCWANKAGLHFAIGTLEQAKQAAQNGVDAADKSADAFQQVNNRATMGHAFHKMTEFAKARQVFDEAIRINLRWAKQLRALQGTRYCDFLLDLGQYEEVRDHADEFLPWTIRQRWRREVALEHLNRGWAWSYIEGPNSQKAKCDLDEAVTILRQTGYQQYVPQALIARSAFHRRRALRGDEASRAEARKDLVDAFDIVHRTGNLLAECDALCIEARLWLDEGNVGRGNHCVDRLQELIAAIGYQLRTFDLSLLRAWIAVLQGQSEHGKAILAALRQETREISYRACDEDINLVSSLL